jgi:heme A synthase
MSGLSLIVIIGLFVWAWKAYPKSHPVRLGSSLSLLFVITEALVGAGLVLFQWVAGNASIGRTISVAIHLVNTFLLLASLSLTAWWASGGKVLKLERHRGRLVGLSLALLGVLLLSVTGAINALGDTLFPASSLSSGVQQDFAPGAHFLLRLRVWHPFMAAMVGFYIIYLVSALRLKLDDLVHQRLSLIVGSFVLLQLIAGLVNLLLLAPWWMQIIHLFLADSLWISLVLLSASVLGMESQPGESSPGRVKALSGVNFKTYADE